MVVLGCTMVVLGCTVVVLGCISDTVPLISVLSVSLPSNPVEYSVLKDPVPFQEEMRVMKVGPKC